MPVQPVVIGVFVGCRREKHQDTMRHLCCLRKTRHSGLKHESRSPLLMSSRPWTTLIQVCGATLMRLQAGTGFRLFTPAQLESPPHHWRSLVTIQMWYQLRPQVPAHQRTTPLQPICRLQTRGGSCAPKDLAFRTRQHQLSRPASGCLRLRLHGWSRSCGGCRCGADGVTMCVRSRTALSNLACPCSETRSALLHGRPLARECANTHTSVVRVCVHA